ncbi:hypothetical protein ACK8OR_05795 [Jannaschia sp. KMU-145]|uniref:hypothetical protein n=1 Tax=Jannaschia halovivens TaxID=3388667 RepID=UPI00396B06B5
MDDNQPATPPQLAANGKAASDAVAEPAAPDAGAAERLQVLLHAVEEAEARWGALDGASGDDLGALVDDWRAAHLGHRDELSSALVGLRVEPESAAGAGIGGEVAGIGATLTGLRPATFKRLLRAENAILDLYTDTGRADPEHRGMFDRHRAELVALANRTQERIDP